MNRIPLAIVAAGLALSGAFGAEPFFEIEVVDAATGRGVPLVELKTVNSVRHITDSAGRVAFHEPGLNGQTVFFHVTSHGYEFPKDGFGMRGARLTITPGGKSTLKITRRNIAERLYRVTGEGIYRDSVLLGYETPLDEPLLNAQVAGQDSIQRVLHAGKIHWFWGDTTRMSYPLGNFRMSGATSDIHSDPSRGFNLRYLTNAEGFTKEIFPLPPPGDLIWADGFLVAPDETGRERMLAHYQRLKGLGKPIAQGLAIFNDAKQEFELAMELDLNEKWRFPHGHPLLVTNSGENYFYFGHAFPNVRTRARLRDCLDKASFEAFTCLADGAENNAATATLDRDAAGKLRYRWTRLAPPIGPKLESELIAAGKLRADEAHFQPVDVETGKVVQMHGGTVAWNSWRKRWILIAVQQGGSSFLGEIWYSEAGQPTGPWRKARKIVTHDRYSFYNPAHHPFFDQEGGRIIYFEGTYTAEFSGNTFQTPRYDYNQIMYRLNLADPRLVLE